MVQIITDSSVMYTEDEAKAAGFEAIPLCIHIGELEGRDLQIDMEDFTGGLRKGRCQDPHSLLSGRCWMHMPDILRMRLSIFPLQTACRVPITVHAVPERWQITKRELRCLTAGLCAVPTGI